MNSGRRPWSEGRRPSDSHARNASTTHRKQAAMTVTPNPPASPPPDEEHRRPILGLEALVLLLITGLAILAAVQWPAIGTGIAVGAAVLAVLVVLVRR